MSNISNNNMFLRSRESLTREIGQTFESVQESEATARKKRRWCDSLEKNIKEMFPTRQLVLVGSSTTGFAIEGCDVDMTLIRMEGMTHYGSMGGVQVLRRIRDALRERPVIGTELIDGAVVPILKLNDRSERLEGDISVDIQNSIFNTYLQKCYGKMDRRVTPLVVIVKYWAQRSGITGAHDHKLSGFAVVLLVIYYLQTGCSPPVLPSLQSSNPTHFSTSSSASATADKLASDSFPLVVTSYNSLNSDSVGNLLVGFFNFYTDFNWNKVLSVRLAGFKPVPFDKKWTRPKIRIEDPFDWKNVTRAVYKDVQFYAIKQAFRTARQRLANEHCRLAEIL